MILITVTKLGVLKVLNVFMLCNGNERREGIFTRKNKSSTTIISYGIWIDLVTILSRIGRGVKTSPTKIFAFLEVSAH